MSERGARRTGEGGAGAVKAEDSVWWHLQASHCQGRRGKGRGISMRLFSITATRSAMNRDPVGPIHRRGLEGHATSSGSDPDPASPLSAAQLSPMPRFLPCVPILRNLLPLSSPKRRCVPDEGDAAFRADGGAEHASRAGPSGPLRRKGAREAAGSPAGRSSGTSPVPLRKPHSGRQTPP